MFAQLNTRKLTVFSSMLVFLLCSCDKNRFTGNTSAIESSPKQEDVNPEFDEQSSAPGENLNDTATAASKPLTQAGGVPGGHFDLDTSTQTYDFNAGTTVHHVHEYDDKFNVTGVDFFKMLDPKFVEPAKAITADQSFKIIVANAQLSPGARITINDKTYLATDWQKRTASGDLPAFSLGGVAGTQKLTGLNITFDGTKPISGQLIPTETGLVRANAPGPAQTYRAGALVIQMVDAKTAQIDSNLGVAKIGVPGMLWESTLFWHFKAPAAADK